MKHLVKTCLVVTLISILATVAPAGPQISAGQEATLSVPAPESSRCLTVWCQEPVNGFYVESQISSIPEEVVTIIADFTSPSDEAVTSMKWWGLLVGGTGPVENFVITFYQFGDCSGPNGEAIYERMVYDWSEVEIDWDLTEYSATFEPVPMNAGQTYWVSVQAVMDIATGGYWAWGSSPTELCPSLGTAPSYGVLDWTPVYPYFFPDLPELEDRAFCLYADGSVSTEPSSLGNVKALFR